MAPTTRAKQSPLQHARLKLKQIFSQSQRRHRQQWSKCIKTLHQSKPFGRAAKNTTIWYYMGWLGNGALTSVRFAGDDDDDDDDNDHDDDDGPWRWPEVAGHKNKTRDGRP